MPRALPIILTIASLFSARLLASTPFCHEVLSEPLYTISTDGTFRFTLPVSEPINQNIEKFTQTDKLSSALNRFLQDRSSEPYFTRLAKAMALNIHSSSDLQKIPKTGPLIVVANHPLNGTDGIALAAMISQVRSDVKVVLTELLKDVPEMKKNAFFLSVLETNEVTRKKNQESLAQMTEYLQNGGALVIFPSGAISTKKSLNDTKTIDYRWRKGVAHLWKAVPQSQVLPIFIDGSATQLFYYAKKLTDWELKVRNVFQTEKRQALSQHLVSLMHVRELSENIGRNINVTLGPVLNTKFLESWKNEKGTIQSQQMMNMLQELTFDLANQ